MKFLFWNFGKKKEPDLSNLEIDEKNNCGEEKKNKFTIEETDSEEIFYVHEQPKPVNEENIMGMSIEKPDQSSQQATYMDDSGNEVFVNPKQLNKVPDGLNVPGLGNFSNQTKKSNPQNNKQSKANQNMNTVPVQQAPVQNAAPPVQNAAPSMQQKPPRKPTTTPKPQPQPQVQGGVYYPPTEVAMVEGAYHLFVDMAGVEKEDIQVVFDNNVLVISGKRESSVEKLKKALKKPKVRKNPIQQSNVTVPEALLGKFEFRYPFRKQIDEPSMQAKFENGLLEIILPHRVKGDQVAVPIM